MSTEPIFDAIGIVASDLPRSVAFYRRVGLAFPDVGVDEQHVEADSGSVRVMLDSEELIRGLVADWDGTGSGRVGLAVRCSSPDQVDSLYAELAADGFGHTEPYDAFWGQRYASVRDPDGQQVDLYAALPRSTVEGES